MKRFSIFLIILLGAIFRLGYLITPIMDSDQAIFGLQAIHILKGEFPIFSWGYAYMGTLQSYLDAIFFFFFGPSRYMLNFVPIFFYLGYALSLYYIAKTIFANFSFQLMTLTLGCLAPNYFIIYGAWGRHGYPETYCFGSLMLAMACLNLYQNKKLIFYLTFGFIAGLAWWSNFLILYYFPAIGLFFLVQLFAAKNITNITKIILGFLGGFLFGSFPFWLYNFQNNFASFAMFTEPNKKFLPVIEKIITYFFPVLIGTREHGFKESLSLIPSIITLVCGFAFIFFLLYRTIRFIQNIFKKKIAAIDLIWLLLITIIAVFLRSSYNTSITSLRYLLPFYSVYPIVIVYFLKKLSDNFNYRIKTIYLLLFFAILISNMATIYNSSPLTQEKHRRKYQQKMEYQHKLYNVLEAKGLTRFVMYNYWEAPKFTFDAKEKLIFACMDSRYPQYIYDMIQKDEVNYLLPENQNFEKGLTLLGYTAKKELVTGFKYTIYNNFKKIYNTQLSIIDSNDYLLSSNLNSVNLSNLTDGNITTNYEIHLENEFQHHYIDVLFKETTNLSGITLFLNYKKHMPYNIEIINLETKNIIVDTKNSFLGYKLGSYPYLPDRPEYIELFFAPINTKNIRIIFKAATVPVLKIDELLFFQENTAEINIKENNIFAHLKSPQYAWETIHCSTGAIGQLQKEFNFKLADLTKQEISFKQKNLFVFRSEYLNYNQAQLQKINIDYETLKGNTFSAIITKENSWKKAFWKDQLILTKFNRKEAAKHYQKAQHHISKNNINEAILELEKAIFFLPAHFEALTLLHKLYTQNDNTAKLRQTEKKLSFLTPNQQQKSNFAGKIKLEGISLTKQEIKAATKFEITYFLHLLKTLKIHENLFIFVHFKDKEGNILFQNDHRLCDIPLLSFNETANSTLFAGEMIVDKQQIVTPSTISYKGEITIWMGIWNPKKGKRWKIETNKPNPPDNIQIGTITLK